MKNILIVLLGPTGVGKTDLSIDLAVHFRCDIISADSRQFYREMNIGTAVPSPDQLSRVKHHFIGFLSVKDYYSASLYERDVLRLLPSLFARNPLVLMTGGSGLYIDAVCRGIDDIPDTDQAIRRKYVQKYREEGIESLRMLLRMLDPVYYEKVDLKNPRRIIRALEICESTGRPYSAFLTKKEQPRNFEVIRIGINRPREELFGRINRRVDEMIAAGLEDEAERLYSLRGINALNSVGYTELFEYFSSRITREQAIGLIKRNSRRYAKRQLTWWNRDREIAWFGADEKNRITEYLSNKINSLSE
ncbi:MAG TPA: tRNA (adenosine(37)-N6)-dimethylallyltransferase MiaA [Bacteroidales bacterium]|jgi:tRNA dimethylallyltransferase|nr:tRNA (adenosine(37)-N6)-dimethylallyltransferase MiaA [Bacteroidales bacterium]HQH25394.1 tRNA (adenosine(37)-N6)-dimethylallyltransferase MiaA [Bacteroidales bacterium]HQJ83184.1 tRNA (adenosine(37)-N6)-dimethylallyltransferase MiaA [Bacteroidales bacterium]